jgi:hypothetical protein
MQCNAMQFKTGSAASSASGQRGLLKVQPRLSWLLLADHVADSKQHSGTVSNSRHHGEFSLQKASG